MEKHPAKDDRNWATMFKRLEGIKPSQDFVKNAETRLRKLAVDLSISRSVERRKKMIRLLLVATSGIAATLIAGLGLGRMFESSVDRTSGTGIVERQGVPGETPRPGDEKAAGDEQKEPATPGGEKTPPKEFKVAVQFKSSDVMGCEEVNLPLTQLIRGSDVIVAGQFVLGGHDNSFIVREVIAGGEVPQQIQLLTDNGLICPAPAYPKLGSWAVAFAEAGGGSISVPSHGKLRQFADERTFVDFVARTKAYVAGKAVPLILSMIKEQIKGQAGAKAVDLADLEKVYKKMQELQDAMQRGEKVDESELERLNEMLGGVRGEVDTRTLLSSLDQLLQDLQLIGGLEAGIGVMEILGAGALEPAVRRDVMRSLAGLRIALEKSALDDDSRAPGDEDSAAADRALVDAREALLKELGEGEAGPGEKPDDGPRKPTDADRERLQEMIRRGNELARELGGAAGRLTCAPEEPTEDKLVELAERTRVLCGLVGRGELSADLAPNKAKLEQVADKLRATIFKAAVLDAAQALDIRLVALVGITDCGYYDTLTLEQVGELLHDKSLHLKQQAAFLCGKAQMKQAVPHLLAALKETPTDLEQPLWYYGFDGRLCGSGFFVKLDIFQALGELKSHDAVPALIDCFKEPPIEGKNMRSWIADTLVRLISKDTAAQYEELLRDPCMDEESRKKLSAALEKVK